MTTIDDTIVEVLVAETLSSNAGVMRWKILLVQENAVRRWV